ncbi:STAS domain-containing protein [Vibrio kasasachensis]|uniref:STAS domain-containing protein n=1 Tax=Vibrio kasasachensis TaxID=2910248 RepID=UPI003D0CA64D
MELHRIEITGTTLKLVINGNLDADGSRSAQPQIDDIIANQSHSEVEVDFRNVQFLDPSGVGALVYLYKRLVEKQRTMRIERVTGQPLEIISLLRIDKAIPVNSNEY